MKNSWQFNTLIEADPICVQTILESPPHNQPRDLILSFSSIGHDSTRVPSPEFVQSARGRNPAQRQAMFITDQSRSWGNHPNFTASLHQIWRDLNPKPAKSMAMGLSMGGYCALVAAQILPIDTVLAFGPQISPLDDDGIGKARWAPWTTNLQTLTWPRAPLAPQAQIYMLHGLLDDQSEAEAFPLGPNVTHILFDNFSHSTLMTHLKACGLLISLSEAALAQDRRRVLRLCVNAGGRLRKS